MLRVRNRMGRFERRQNPFQPRQGLKRIERLRVGHMGILRAPDGPQPGVLGPNRRVVEARGNRMGQLDIAVLVLQHERARALEHARAAAGKPRGVPAADNLLAARLHADQAHLTIVDERIEDADRVAAAADARHDRVRKPAGLLDDLPPRFAADHRLKLAHHQRVGVRPQHRPEQVIRVGHVGDPVAHRLVDGVFQRPAAGVHAADLRTEQPHAEHVQRLPIHVLGAHVDMTLEAEQCAGRGRRDAMLSGAGFGDDAPLAHAGGQQRLAERVVDLVRACVREVFAFEKDSRAAGRLAEPLRLVQRGGAADIVLQQSIELDRESGIVTHGKVCALELFDRLNERLRNVSAAEFAEVSTKVRIAPGCHSHRSSRWERARLTDAPPRGTTVNAETAELAEHNRFTPRVPRVLR